MAKRLFFLLALLLACSATRAQQQNFPGSGSGSTPGVFSASADPPMVQNYTVTTTGRQTGLNLTQAPIDTHQMQWRPVGVITSCSIQLDTSADGVTWTSGGAITSQSCATAGQISVSGVIANYVAPNVTALAGGGTVTVEYAGRFAPLPAGGALGVPENFGAENNAMNNNGGNTYFPILRPTLVNALGGGYSMYLNNSPRFYTHITTATNTQVRSGGSYLTSITVNTTAAGAITIVDTSAANCTGGTTIAILPASVAVGVYTYNVNTTLGLCVITGAASDITVSAAPLLLSQCFFGLNVSRGAPPRYSGAQEFFVAPASSVIGPFLVQDPNNVTPHGNGNTANLFTGILKSISPADHANLPIHVNYPGGVLLNAGDWVNQHMDCNNPTGTTIDAEVQYEMAAINIGAAPQYVQLVNDTFVRANENPLSFSSWWTKNTLLQNAQLASNQVEGVLASNASMMFLNAVGSQPNATSQTPPNDQYAETQVAIAANINVNQGPAVRFSPSVATGYMLLINGPLGASTPWAILRDVAGSITTLASGTATIAAGNWMRLEIKGTSLTAKICTINGANPTCVTPTANVTGSNPVTDATTASGQVGLWIQPDGTIANSQISGWAAGAINF